MAKNLLFWFQVIMAWVYSVPQVLAIQSGETKGLTLVLYIGFLIYLVMGLSLSISSYKAKPTRDRKLIIFIFVQWSVFIGTMFVLGLDKIVWHENDTLILLVMLGLSLFTLLYYKGLKDPYSRGFMSLWYKSVPQLWLSYTIFDMGTSQGLPLITLIAGHATSVPRLWEVWLSGYDHGWDRPTKGLFFGEFINVATWTVVTVLWVLFQN